MKTAYIQVVEGKHWRAVADSLYIDYRPVVADRGNIFAEDGSFLATSLPTFKVSMDCKSTAMSDELFNQYVDTLAHCLATLKDSPYTEGGYEKILSNSVLYFSTPFLCFMRYRKSIYSKF